MAYSALSTMADFTKYTPRPPLSSILLSLSLPNSLAIALRRQHLVHPAPLLSPSALALSTRSFTLIHFLLPHHSKPLSTPLFRLLPSLHLLHSPLSRLRVTLSALGLAATPAAEHITSRTPPAP